MFELRIAVYKPNEKINSVVQTDALVNEGNYISFNESLHWRKKANYFPPFFSAISLRTIERLREHFNLHKSKWFLFGQMLFIAC